MVPPVGDPMRPRDLFPHRRIFTVLGKRSVPMKRQLQFPFAQEDMSERIALLNEEQRTVIRTALKTLFEAALSVAEDAQDEQRKS